MREVPVGFSAIRLTFDIKGNFTEEQRATLIRLAERYCVVYQTLCQPPPVQASTHCS
ncbi:MAG: OsmC family protein [Rhizobiales bacterium]|nr:OsmC family protein [Hyphomicrobiales bacterium]